MMVSHLHLPCNTRQTVCIIKVFVFYLFGNNLVWILATTSCVYTLRHWDCHYSLCVGNSASYAIYKVVLNERDTVFTCKWDDPLHNLQLYTKVHRMWWTLCTFVRWSPFGIWWIREKFSSCLWANMVVKSSDCSLVSGHQCFEGAYCHHFTV